MVIPDADILVIWAFHDAVPSNDTSAAFVQHTPQDRGILQLNVYPSSTSVDPDDSGDNTNNTPNINNQSLPNQVPSICGACVPCRREAKGNGFDNSHVRVKIDL